MLGSRGLGIVLWLRLPMMVGAGRATGPAQSGEPSAAGPTPRPFGCRSSAAKYRVPSSTGPPSLAAKGAAVATGKARRGKRQEVIGRGRGHRVRNERFDKRLGSRLQGHPGHPRPTTLSQLRIRILVLRIVSRAAGEIQWNSTLSDGHWAKIYLMTTNPKTN